MKIDSIQNNISFNAKLRVLGKFFVREELQNLTRKADKIGYEQDIIELSYKDYKDNSIEFLDSTKTSILDKITSTLKARFIPNGDGEGTEFFKENFAADNYADFWKKEENAANMYLDKLYKKYPNERIGISIIEN